ncbi:MAG: photosynthesis system II assembly factor Ycf48 [Rubricoccaceae bacterium]
MKWFALLLSLIVACPVWGQSGWAVIDAGTTEDILAISPQIDQALMIIGTNGFAARANPILISQWGVVDLGTTEDLLSIVRYGSRGFWVSGRNGVMRHSADRGSSWQDKDLPDLTQSYVLASAPGNAVFAFGNAGGAYVSGSPTASWQTRNTGITGALHSLERYPFTVRPFGLVVGEGGILLSVNETGATWTPISSGTTEDLHDILRVTETDWLIVGSGGLILKSSDGGETWSPRTSGTTATLYGLAGSTGDPRVLAVGENGTALESTDAGETWVSRETGTDATLYAAFLRAASSWLVAGAGGTLLQASVGVASESGPEVGYRLSEISPNPVAARAAISLSVDRSQRVIVELVDGLGRRVRTLHEGAVASSTTVPIEAVGLPPGMYVVHVQGETFTESRQMTVVQ